jgi:hypothetical protein
MKAISVTIGDKQLEWLKEAQLRYGSPVSVQVRRALDVHFAGLKVHEGKKAEGHALFLKVCAESTADANSTKEENAAKS